MRKLLVLLFLVSSIMSYGQDVSYFTQDLQVQGDKEFNRFAYRPALNFYLKAYNYDSASGSLNQKIADCYRLLNDQSNAEGWYKRLVAVDSSRTEDNVLYYAQALSSNQKYAEAEQWFLTYKEIAADKALADRKLSGIQQLPMFYRDSGYYELFPVKVNSKAPDFSPAFYKEGLVFVSGRNYSRMIKKVFNWDNSSYLDLFYADIELGHVLTNVEQFNTRINTKYHEGPLAFYQNESKVIFTRNNFFQGKEERSKDDINKLKLFFAENVDGNWSNLTPFEYNDNEFSVGHPTINEDGSILVFASDMPGATGKTDLWVTYRSESGWTLPKNLGSQINTTGAEMFPHWKDGILYFSSDGHQGLGGLDVYEVAFDGYTIGDEVYNLGAPLNSSKDDFGYVTKDGGRSGYFSSNRAHELYDDIYFFKFSKPQIALINGLVEREGDLLPIDEADVYLIDSLRGDTIQHVVSDRKGRFSAQVPWDRYVNIVAVKEHMLQLNQPSFSTFSHHNEEVVIMMRSQQLVANVIAVDEDTREMIPKPHIIVLDPNTGLSLVPENIDVDTFQFVIEPGLTYDVAGAKRQYFTKHVDRFSGDEQYGSLFWEVPLGEIELDKAIKLDNIYYDLNKWNIREDAAKELDKLVETLKSNPTVVIELSAHTDSRGDDDYNKWLSQQRAESVMSYLAEHGIAKDRLGAKGYGEEQLTNGCANDVACTKAQHQDNRRTEFKVVSY